MLNFNQEQKPQQAGGINPMLALGIGLLQAGGPSRQPVGFGQALANGMQMMQQTQQQGFENQMRELQANKLRQDMQTQNERMQALRNAPSELGLNLTPTPEFTGPRTETQLNNDVKVKNAPFANLPEGTKKLANLAFAVGDYEKGLAILAQNHEYGAPIRAMDPKTGQPVYLQVDKQGNTKPVQGYSPLIEKGMQITTNPDGTMSFEQGGYDTGLTKPTVTELQQGVIGLKDSLNRMDAVAKDYSGNYLTIPGQIRAGTASTLGKLTGKSGDKEFLQGKTKFENGTEQLFNAYRKEITGAAASVQELDRLKKSMLNVDQSPEEFEASYSQFRDIITSSIALKEQLLSQGLKPDSKELGTAIDSAILGKIGDNKAPKQTQTNSGKILKYNPTTGGLD